MKKILFLADAGSIHTARYIDYFCLKDDYEVLLVTFSQKNCTSIKCNNIIYLSKGEISASGGNYHYLFFVFSLADIIRKFNPDCINAHYSYSMGLVALIGIFISGIKCSLSIVCHGSDILDYPHWLCRYINKVVLEYADKIIAVSELIFEELCRMGIDANKIFVGQYGVDIPEYEENKKDIDIISIRSYVKNSRIDDILTALESIKDVEKKKIIFVVPCITKKRLVELRELFPFVTFYEMLEHDRILEFLHRSKVYVSATKSDGTSLSLIEAMVRGVCPVISNIKPNQPWVIDRENGFLFNNLEEMKKNIETALMMSDEELLVMYRYNYELIKRKCNYKTQMRKIGLFLFGK